MFTKSLRFKFPPICNHHSKLVFFSSSSTTKINLANYFNSNSNSFKNVNKNYYNLNANVADITTNATILSPISNSKSKTKILSLLNLMKTFGELGKFKLSSLVCFTSMSGYLAGIALIGGEFSLLKMISTIIGTGLCSFSDNSLNHLIEVPYDSQMNRTRNRPLIRLAATPFGVFNFALLTGLSGTGILAFLSNPISAFLASSNIILYAFVYTPLKRFSILNTWIGAIVGAIPPLIGWFAGNPSLTTESMIFPLILFFWQFPHFNALSFNFKNDYARAGYRMTSFLDPLLNQKLAFKHSVNLSLVCLASSPLLISFTDLSFIFTSSIINIPLLINSFKFYSNPSKKTARILFFTSLLHLPLILILFLFHIQKRKKIKAEREI
jgi:protoheme IX farnesyltransferase